MVTAFFGCDAPGGETRAQDWFSAEELGDEESDAASHDLAVADGHPEVGLVAEALDVGDRVTVAAGGDRGELASGLRMRVVWPDGVDVEALIRGGGLVGGGLVGGSWGSGS